MAVEVLYDGALYSSVSEFCQKENLRPYSAVLRTLNDGWSPEDIVKTYGPDAAKNVHLISFQGKLYKSLAQAVTDIGTDPAMAYAIKKKYNFTPEETLDYLISHKNPNRGQGKTIPICIEGVYYKSQADAARAYHLSRVTITSRMLRENISFEEALIKADHYRKHLPNTKSVLIGASVTPMRKGSLTDMTKLQQEVYGYLKESFLSVSVYQVSEQPIFVFPYETKKKKPLTCQITVGTAGNELYIPLLMEDITESFELYQEINKFNRENIGSKLWLTNDHISASWSMFISPAAYGSLKIIKQTTAAFLEGCGNFVDNLAEIQKD